MVGMAAVLAGSARAPLTALLLLFELTRDIRIVLPLMAAAGLSAALVERWQGFDSAGLVGADPIEEQRRATLASLPVREAFEPSEPLVLSADKTATDALALLAQVHGHALLVIEEERVTGLVTLQDLQRCLSSTEDQAESLTLGACRRGDLLWLPDTANLDRLEDQLVPGDLRQIPVFAVDEGLGSYLPSGLPIGGLPLASLRGMASRDGLAWALARHVHQRALKDQRRPLEQSLTSASATGSD
jgi:hypothetical protein